MISTTAKILFNPSYRKQVFSGIWKNILIASVGSPIVYTLGDYVAQNIEYEEIDQYKNKEFQLDRIRLYLASYHGLVLNGISLPIVYRWLETVYGPNPVKNPLPVIAKKVATMQLLYAPISTSYFLFSHPAMESLLQQVQNTNFDASHYNYSSDKSWKTDLSVAFTNSLKLFEVARVATAEGIRNVKQNFFSIYTTGFQLWVVSDFLNLLFIPVHMRPYWDSTFDVLWTSYVSFSSHKKTMQQEQSIDKEEEKKVLVEPSPPDVGFQKQSRKYNVWESFPFVTGMMKGGKKGFPTSSPLLECQTQDSIFAFDHERFNHSPKILKSFISLPTQRLYTHPSYSSSIESISSHGNNSKELHHIAVDSGRSILPRDAMVENLTYAVSSANMEDKKYFSSMRHHRSLWSGKEKVHYVDDSYCSVFVIANFYRFFYTSNIEKNWRETRQRKCREMQRFNSGECDSYWNLVFKVLDRKAKALF